MNIEQRFRDLSATHGAAIAIDDGATVLTFGAVQAQADIMARQLRTAQLRRAEPVVVTVANRATDIAAFLAVWQAQGVVVPVHKSMPAKARDALHTRLANRFVVDDGLQRIASEPAPLRAVLRDAGTIIFTSGSTGLPKGVVLSHQRAADKLNMIQRMTGWQAGDNSLLGLQLTFSFGQWAAWLTLLNGGCVYLRARFDASQFQQLLDSEKVQRFPAVPTMLRHLLDLQQTSRFAGHIMCGGEPLPAALGHRILHAYPNAKLGDIYGLTETGTSDFFVDGSDYHQQAGTIGRAGEQVQWRIDSITQELQIRSPWQMLGYLDDTDLSDAAFDDGWFKTGDLAEHTKTGSVRIIGRAKELIVRSGNKISPLEVEAAFLGHPEVKAALATGITTPGVGEAIHLAVVLKRCTTCSTRELQLWASQHLERFKMPDVIHRLEELPLGATGKADRKLLQAQILDKLPDQ